MTSDNFRAIRPSRLRVAVAAVAALVVASSALVVGGSTVGAVTTPGAAYAEFTTPAGANPSWTSSLSMTGAAGFPSATIATNSLSPSVPSGASTWLSAATPFGTQFASSQNQKYLSFSPTTGQAMSTTVVTFASLTPVTGWGFAFGDVDAEAVGVSATDASGAAVSASDLGFQSSFNLCNVPSPKPSTCSGVVTYDAPTWIPGSNSGVLQGNTNDTVGASGWFMPLVAIRTLTITSTNLSGIPTATLWIASNLRVIAGTVTQPETPPEPTTTTTEAPTTTSSSTTTSSTSSSTSSTTSTTIAPTTTTTVEPTPNPDPVPDAVIEVIDSTGTVVAETTTDSNGDFSFPAMAPGIYTLVEIPPAGSLPPADFPMIVDVTYGNVTGIIVVNSPAVPKFTG